MAGRLVQYLETNRLAAARQEITQYKGQSAIPGAQTGDVIAYDWGDGNGINHLSMVTIASQYATQVTAHTNPRLNASWDLDTSGDPQVRMYLIHIYSPYSI